MKAVIFVLAVLAVAALAAEPLTPATVLEDSTLKSVEKDGKLFYPANVIDPNSPQRVYLGEGDAFRTLPAEVVHSTVYGLPAAATAVLPPIPTFGPKYHRRAMHRVRKSLELLDRAYDALSAHLKQLAAMRTKVQAKLDHLQTMQLSRGYLSLPEHYDGTFNGRVARKFLKSYMLNAMEQGASAKPHKHEVTPKEVAALIEAESEVEETN